MDRSAAQDVLECRPGATAREVRAAYRRLLRVARPDTGGAGADWLARVQAARDVLLPGAAPDRRRRDRRDRGGPTGPSGYVALRRSTWAPADRPAHLVDLRL